MNDAEVEAWLPGRDLAMAAANQDDADSFSTRQRTSKNDSALSVPYHGL